MMKMDGISRQEHTDTHTPGLYSLALCIYIYLCKFIFCIHSTYASGAVQYILRIATTNVGVAHYYKSCNQANVSGAQLP